MLVGMVDVIFADVAQPDQAVRSPSFEAQLIPQRIVALNACAGLAWCPI